MKIKRAQILRLILLAATICVITVIGISSFNKITKNITLAEAFTKAKDRAEYECNKSLELDCKTLKLWSIEDKVCENIGVTDSGNECGFWSFNFLSKDKNSTEKHILQKGVNIVIKHTGEIDSVKEIKSESFLD